MNELIAIEKIEQWEKLKKLVLDSVSSPITKRVYNMALNEFMAWFQQAPRPGFTKATVSVWRGIAPRSAVSLLLGCQRSASWRAKPPQRLAPEFAQGISHA